MLAPARETKVVMVWLYRALAKPLLFRLDPERAHEWVSAWARLGASTPGAGAALEALYGSPRSQRLRSTVCGIEFPNPIGLAAGFDKTGELYPFLKHMGFGFIECGTFTARAQPGNPKPRLFRFPEHEALVNRMGFNNPGAEAAGHTLRSQRRSVPRGVSIGKSKRTPLAEAAADHRQSLHQLTDCADFVALNVSSPNTAGLRGLQRREPLRDLLADARRGLAEEAERLGVKRPPLFVKLAPDLGPGELEEAVEVALETGVDGLILTNTTLRKEAVPEARDVEGGLSGAPLRALSTDLVRRAHRASGGRLAIIGVGGVFSGEDALEKIRAGASLVQVYTGYVYRGPGLPRAINRFLDARLRREGARLADWIGSEAR
jgi:dihydroorotate dehydrogenase